MLKIQSCVTSLVPKLFLKICEVYYNLDRCCRWNLNASCVLICPLISDCLQFSYILSRNCSCTCFCKRWPVCLGWKHLTVQTACSSHCLPREDALQDFLSLEGTFYGIESLSKSVFSYLKMDTECMIFGRRGIWVFLIPENLSHCYPLPVTTLGAQSGNCAPVGKGSGKYLDIVQEERLFTNISCCYSGGWESNELPGVSRKPVNLLSCVQTGIALPWAVTAQQCLGCAWLHCKCHWFLNQCGILPSLTCSKCKLGVTQ